MKVLLDENLPRPLTKHFSIEATVLSVHDLGWASKKNGELLKAMKAAEIEILVTADRNLVHQQNIAKSGIHIIVLKTRHNRYKTLVNHVQQIEKAILAYPLN